MKKFIWFIISFVAGFIITECSKPVEVQDSTLRELTPVEKRITSASGNFGFSLFNSINQKGEKENIFISPLSVSMSLGITLNGAEGSTYDAIKKTLQLDNLTEEEIKKACKSLIELLLESDSKTRMEIANSIWLREGLNLRSQFSNKSMEYFNASVSALNFSDPSASDFINDWVERNTNGKIDKMIEGSIDEKIVMLLLNAIYLNGDWKYKFDKSKTSDELFYTDLSNPVKCRMMNQKSKFMYLQNEQLQVIDLLYGNGNFSMSIILPKQNENIDELIKILNTSYFSNLISALKETELEINLPAFTLEYEIELNDYLKNLGMEIAFDENRADFSRILQTSTSYGNLYINKVKHKTFVKVDEEGTEAAAVTSVEIAYTSIANIMRVDRPFIFVIRENKSNTLLFIGKIVNPGT